MGPRRECSRWVCGSPRRSGAVRARSIENSNTVALLMRSDSRPTTTLFCRRASTALLPPGARTSRFARAVRDAERSVVAAAVISFSGGEPEAALAFTDVSSSGSGGGGGRGATDLASCVTEATCRVPPRCSSNGVTLSNVRSPRRRGSSR